jgi:hypothetical protein
MARQFRETLEEEVQLEETRKPRSSSGDATGTGTAASAGASATTPAGGSAAVAGGIAASEPPEPVFDTSNIPFSDAPQNPTYAPTYDSSAYSTGHGTGGDAAPGVATDADADTRHNDYAGAAYEPPATVSDAPAAPPADATGHAPEVQSDVQRGT